MEKLPSSLKNQGGGAADCKLRRFSTSAAYCTKQGLAPRQSEHKKTPRVFVHFLLMS